MESPLLVGGLLPLNPALITHAVGGGTERPYYIGSRSSPMIISSGNSSTGRGVLGGLRAVRRRRGISKSPCVNIAVWNGRQSPSSSSSTWSPWRRTTSSPPPGGGLPATPRVTLYHATSHIQGGRKIGTVFLYALTSANIDQFSNLFHC